MHINRQVASALDALSHWPRFRMRLFAEGAVVGIVSGTIISFFRWALEAGTEVREYIYDSVLIPGGWAAWFLWMAVLLVAACVIGRLCAYEPNAGGSGIPQVKGVILGVIRLRWLRILWVKLVGGIIGISLGLSLGREGPSIQIGAVTAQGISRILGRFRLEERYLLTAGASAGLAAAFNAPLAGVMFALEELHRNFSGVVLAPAMAAALIATMVSRFVFGSGPVFEFGVVPALPLSYIWIAVVIGIIAGIGGIIFNQGLLHISRFYSLPCFRSSCSKVAFALVIAGILGYVFPQVLGGGNELINTLSAFPLSLRLFAALLIGKFIFTLISYGCGAPGGFFLPMLVLGALTGSVAGILLLQLGSISPEYLPTVVILAMAAFFSASVQSPVTGTILIMEMTASYEHLLALCIASLVALITAQACGGRPIYEALLQRILTAKRTALLASERRHLLELTVASGSEADGKYIGHIAWPGHAVIVDIKRSNTDILPGMDIRLQAGDYLYVLTDSVESAESVRHLVEVRKL